MSKITIKNMLLISLSFLLCSLLLHSCDQQQTQSKTEEISETPPYDGTIIAVGDSLTAGLGVVEKKSWPALLEKKLKNDGHRWQVINAGISGETSSGTLSRMQWIVAQQPAVVILETGANDGFRGVPPAVIRKNINNAVQILQDNNITVVLAGMQIVQNLGEKYAEEFAAIYPSIAHERDCLLIPFILQRVAGEPTLNQADTIHPNEEGHAIITETAYPFVIRALQALQQHTSVSG